MFLTQIEIILCNKNLVCKVYIIYLQLATSAFSYLFIFEDFTALADEIQY